MTMPVKNGMYIYIDIYKSVRTTRAPREVNSPLDCRVLIYGEDIKGPVALQKQVAIPTRLSDYCFK